MRVLEQYGVVRPQLMSLVHPAAQRFVNVSHT